MQPKRPRCYCVHACISRRLFCCSTHPTPFPFPILRFAPPVDLNVFGCTIMRVNYICKYVCSLHTYPHTLHIFFKNNRIDNVCTCILIKYQKKIQDRIRFCLAPFLKRSFVCKEKIFLPFFIFIFIFFHAGSKKIESQSAFIIC